MENVIQINEAALKRFQALKINERLAHAYLLIGPKDSGKGETALAVAKLVNCRESKSGAYCDQCLSCIKINSANHPDIFMIDNGYGEAIKVGQIRELIDRNKLKAFMAEKKVIIIKNIENLTQESANAFLKTLEEPTAETLILLTTSVPERNLDTIRSRCHAINFPPVANDELARQLRNESGLDDSSSRCLANFAQGCLGTARKLRDDNFVARKNEIINTFILRRPGEDSIKRMLADKQQTRAYLDILLSWIRDALLIKAGVNDERLVHLDRKRDLDRFARIFTFDDLNRINKSVIKMHQLLGENLNIKIPLLIIGEQLWAT